MSMPGPSNAQEPNPQLNTFRSLISSLADTNAKDETKQKAAQEICENFENIFGSQLYPSLIEHAMVVFLKVLSEGEPHFIAEYNIQQVRKVILEMMNRLPTHESLKQFEKQIFTLMMKLLQIENEENVLVCLRIIIDLHKNNRPPFTPEIENFLQFVRSIYENLPNHLSKIFEPKQPIRVNDLTELNIENLLSETYTITVIHTEIKLADGNNTSYNLIPRGVLSLKVLQELPIIVLLMYQLYKHNLQQEVAEFIPLIMSTIMLRPTPEQMANPSFNKEVFVDFMGAQIKTLSFLAYIVRIFQELIAQNSTYMITGMLGLLSLCPMEVAHLRKELLIATRHFLATDLRIKFVPFMDRLCDEDLLLGKGWTTHESLRPLAYSTLADLIHHVRKHLPLPVLARAMHLFSKNVHDESLPTNIQTMSCRLLLNLVDCIRLRSDQENGQGRYLLIRMLEVFVQKFKTVAKLHLPILAMRSKTQETGISAKPGNAFTHTFSTSNKNIDKNNAGTNETINPSILIMKYDEKEKSKFGFPISQSANYCVVDCRDLVKALVCGVKSITWGCAACKIPSSDTPSKQFHPNETLIFIRLVKWALQALEIYTLPVTSTVQHANTVIVEPNLSSQRNANHAKEENQVLEHFAGVFSMMHSQTFQEIFFTTIDYMVERFYKNFSLQIVFNTFLSPPTSPVFAYILLEYLLERLEEMGSNQDKSNLYLRLFRMVFASVSIFPQENEHMLRPRLQQIVNKSMELAMSAKEPYNYFLLLRALFRAIGTERNHDLLYLEFLPLLPTLLQGLNSLQSGLHKQHMKDLFIELCLIVPVRLSSLLPYLPMLMNPLVSALNGSHTLISQGLKTLESCVDNLQPDFLYEHIQPVRAELMQALWRILRNPSEHLALIAFRVLGKIGGANRKMMVEPQRLEYNAEEDPAPSLVIYFQNYKTPIELPVQKIIETAFLTLRSSSTDLFYMKQSWEVIRCYLVASVDLDPAQNKFSELFSHNSFTDPLQKIETVKGLPYKLDNKMARHTLQTALTGMFIAAGQSDLALNVLPIMTFIVNHYTLVAISQQTGPYSMVNNQLNLKGMDPLVLIDALAFIMGHEDKDLCKIGSTVLKSIMVTAVTVLGSIQRACQLPFMEYLAERMCSLCYERAWYAKLGGCIAIKYLFGKMSTIWVFDHLFVFLKALLFVMMDLTGEVSYGAIDMAKSNLEKMVHFCGGFVEKTGNDDDLITAQEKALFEVTNELMLQVTSSNTMIREHSMYLLKVLAKVQKKTTSEIIIPHKKAIEDMIPPIKHLLRHQPVNAQIGIMDGNTFCTTLEPRLFAIDIVEHRAFFHEVMSLCEAEDATLMKLACYKSVTNLIPLRKCALRTLSSCYYLNSSQEKILLLLYKSLEKNNPEIQQAAYECLKIFITGMQQLNPEEMAKKTSALVRPLLRGLGEYTNLGLTGVKRLYYIALLFPNQFNLSHCNQMLSHFQSLIVVINNLNKGKGVTKSGENEEKIVTIINIITQIPATPASFMEVLCTLVLNTESVLVVEASSPFRKPLMNFLLRFPRETIELFLTNSKIKNKQWNRYLMYLIKHEDGKPFRDVLQMSSLRLIEMTRAKPFTDSVEDNSLNAADCSELHYQTIRITSLLIKYDEQWLSLQHQIAAVFKQIWSNDGYQDRLTKIETIEHHLWNEPKILVKILLHYFCHHTNDIDLLFQLLRAFCTRYLSDFQFLRDFLEKTVAQEYTVDWKRSAFFRFVELFHGTTLSQELKSKVLQFILIPCFSVSFERGESDRLIGGPASPEQENPDNIVSVFMSKVIDPENPNDYEDCVRILLLQFSCLLVEQASDHIHIHHAEEKKHGSRLRRLMMFAWPCLLVKNCADPTTRYHSHLLLSHIIAKFAIHKRIVLQVFHRLLKAHAVEARTVVRQALEILTPAMPFRMDDGYKMLIHWTKKIYIEEGLNSMHQLLHILQLIIRHYKIYYPVRHHLIQHMISSMHRLGFSMNGQLEHRKVAIELAEIIIKWELLRIRDESLAEESNSIGISGKRPSPDEGESIRKRQAASVGPTPTIVPTAVPKLESDGTKPIKKSDSDSVINILLRLACQVNNPKVIGSEILSKRCFILLKMALRPDVWPYYSDLKLNFLDNIFQSIETESPNLGSICTALELLSYLLGIMTKEHILLSIKPLHKGIIACINTSNTKVLRLVNNSLSSLISIFPIDEVKCTTDENKSTCLESLYSHIEKVISEGLTNYEQNKSAQTNSLFGILMMLKAACSSNEKYIDPFIDTFILVLSRMTSEYIDKNKKSDCPVTSELVILCLDLSKNRIAMMDLEIRKNFINKILVDLIENSKDLKLAKAIIKIIEDWIKIKNSYTKPTIQELSVLLLKMLEHFPIDPELNNQFLNLINFIYRDDNLKVSEFVVKLEPAFLSGLRCPNHELRQKFFQVFNISIGSQIHVRLLYIVSTLNWKSFGIHYWIKQCIEMILSTAQKNIPLSISNKKNLLPGTTSLLPNSDTEHKTGQELLESLQTEMSEIQLTDSNRSNEHDMDIAPIDSFKSPEDLSKNSNKKSPLSELIEHHQKVINHLKKLTTHNFLFATSQLCHLNSDLSQQVWLDLFPNIWNIMNDRQRKFLAVEIVPFLCSASHLVQRDCKPSAPNTFIEAFSRCNISHVIKPTIFTFLGRTYNLWHRMILSLEILEKESYVPVTNYSNLTIEDDIQLAPTRQQLLVDSLSSLLLDLKEEDMWAAVWQRHAIYRETYLAIGCEQQGFYEEAQDAYEVVMSKCRSEHEPGTLTQTLKKELRLWEEGWIRCLKELSQWELLFEYGTDDDCYNPYIIIESSWHLPRWQAMKEALQNVSQICPKESTWKLSLYQGFLTVCNPEDQDFNLTKHFIDNSTKLCIQEWGRFPHIVSHMHLPILQAAQQIVELHESSRIYHDLLQGDAAGIQNIKNIVKTWRNRLPIISDQLSHWSEIFHWRQHHYQYLSTNFHNQSMLGVHANAQSIVHFGKIARKHNLVNVCLDTLGKIFAISSIPTVDCFQKIRQHIKCYIHLASITDRSQLQEALEVIEDTSLVYFPPEMNAEFSAIKGMLLAYTGRSEEANKAFSSAVQMHDTLVKAWALWGEYLEHLFTRNPKQLSIGVSAITCFLHACRHQNESKSRKYLAKVLWLLIYDDDNYLLLKAVDQYSVGVPPIQWLPWIPQLLTWLVRDDGNLITNLINQVGRMFPQALFFPIRTVYLTLKIELKSADAAAAKQQHGNFASGPPTDPSSSSSDLLHSQIPIIKASPFMSRCSNIMKMQHDIHPTVLSTLEGIVDQMLWFRESCYEVVLRQLRQGLAKCLAIAFEKRANVADATITQHTINFVKKLVSMFDIAISGGSSQTSGKESLATRARTTVQDPDFQELKAQFASDFQFSLPGTMKLRNLICKIKKWINILDAKVKTLPKSFLIEEKCRFLSTFSLQTAEVELPGEFLLPRHSHNYVRIAGFLPRVDIVQKHNTAASRLFIRGHNGKIYPYLVGNDSGLGDARREERVLQLLRMLNHFLTSQKETARRFLHFTVPRVVAVYPQMRLIEDNPASISYLDIFKNKCKHLGFEHDAPVFRYYEFLDYFQIRDSQPTPQGLCTILKEIQDTMVPNTILRQWALKTFPSATDYFAFRKIFTLQYSLTCFAEYILYLTRLNPDMMYIHKDTGLINISYFKFDVDDMTGIFETNRPDLETNRPVPFRLTPNIEEFLGPLNISGPLNASMLATARCLDHPSFKFQTLLKAILRDEMIAHHKKLKILKQSESNVHLAGHATSSSTCDIDRQSIINMVTKTVNSIKTRLKSISNFDGIENKVTGLISAANNPEHLCLMDPAWYPWL